VDGIAPKSEALPGREGIIPGGIALIAGADMISESMFCVNCVGIVPGLGAGISWVGITVEVRAVISSGDITSASGADFGNVDTSASGTSSIGVDIAPEPEADISSEDTTPESGPDMSTADIPSESWVLVV
jgi:hypothetical protein